MSTRPAEPEAPGLIYPAQGSTTLISRAWNLFRLNLKTGVLVMLVPTVVYFVFALLLAVIASQDFQIATPGQVLTLILITGAAALAVLVAFIFAYGYCSCALMRFFYLAILNPEPPDIKACWDAVWNRRWSLALLIIGIALASIVFAVADTLVFYLAVLISILTMAGLGGLAGIMQSPLMLVVAVITFLLFGFVILAVLIGLFSVQWFAVIFPLMAVATAEKERPMLSDVGEAFRLLSRNLSRVVVFSLALFLFSMIVSTALHAPVYAWVWYEKSRLGIGNQVALPMHITTVLNLWTGLVNVVLMPFYISAVTLFWYDCKVRTEGLDLRLWFQDLIRRRGKDPRAYLYPPPA